MDKFKSSIGIFLDLTIAFNMTTFEDIGIRVTPHDLFRSYLYSRIQRVKVSDEISDEEIITWGILQGTMLRPILFNVYLNNFFL